MASHDQRKRDADDQAKALAQERAGVVVGSVRVRAQEEKDPIYDAIQEAKKAVEQKAAEAAQKAKGRPEYGEDRDREEVRLMAATGTLGTDEDDYVEIP